MTESPYEAYAQLSTLRRAAFLLIAGFCSASVSAMLAFVASVQTPLWDSGDGSAPVLLALGTLLLSFLFNLFFLLALLPGRRLQKVAFALPVFLPFLFSLAVADPFSFYGEGGGGAETPPLVVAFVLCTPFVPGMFGAVLIGTWYIQRFGVGAGEGWEPEE